LTRPRIRIVATEVPPGAGERSDDELMVLVRADQRQSFRELVARHELTVFGFAARYLGDRVLAEDACQVTFVRLWQQRGQYDPRGRFRAFLLTLCLNTCRELSHGRRRRRAALERLARQSTEQPDSSNEALLLQRERESVVERVIARLPRRAREAVLLRFCGEASYAEMSRILGSSEVALRSRVHDALKRLRHLLREAP